LTIISAHIFKANPNLKKSHGGIVFQQPAKLLRLFWNDIESGFFRSGFLVPMVALPLGNDLLGLAAPVRERLSDIDLVRREFSFRHSVCRPDAIE
jgi:hypothetical protein